MYRLLAIALGCLWLTGCAIRPLESGRDQVLQQTQHRLRLDNAAITEKNCSAAPATLADAMHTALLCNPQVQIALAELDISTAELNQQIRIDNPNLGLTVRDSDSESGVNIELDLLAPVIDLILYPARKSAAQATLDRHRQFTLAAILRLANDLENAWYGWQVADLKAQVGNRFALTRQLNAELGERYHQAGNINLHEFAELQINAGTAGLLEDQLNIERKAMQIKIQRLLGIRQLPKIQQALRILPDSDPDVSTIWQIAQANHPLLQAAQINTDALAQSLALERRFRFLLDFGAGVSLEKEAGGGTSIGPAIELELPLWNQNQAEIDAAQGQLSKGQQQLLALHNHFSAEIQLALGQMQLARSRLARYRQQILPAYKTKMEQTLKEYNYMLTGPFELLETRAEQMETIMAFLDDLGSYWQSASKLSRLSGGSWSPAKTAALQLDVLAPETQAQQTEQNHVHTP